MSKQLQRKVYDGTILTPVKVLGVTLQADPETVAKYNQAVEDARNALVRLKVAVRVYRKPDEKNVIDQ